MNKKELLDDIAALPFCNAIVGDPECCEIKPNGDKWYQVNIREVNGNAAIYRNVGFYVIGEGTDEEASYYKDSAPVATISDSAAGKVDTSEPVVGMIQ